ncbi:MAG: S41 family peptidase [Phycisphaerales bacterium]|nr:S41 family peptidase [Phycisphaerales bacterium]
MGMLFSIFAVLGTVWTVRGELTKTERQALWSDNLSIVETARKSTNGLPPSDLNRLEIKDERVAPWFEVFKKQLDAHEERRARDFDNYVGQIEGHLEKGEILEGLVVASRALANATDKSAVRESAWMKRLVDAALDLAHEKRSDGKWRRAYDVFAYLSSLFEDNKDFEKSRLECLTHARLNAMYGSDDKSRRRWGELLQDIVEQNAVDALDRIEKFHAEVADFKAVTESGLQTLLLICDSDVMRETFPKLADESLRESFRARLQARLERVLKSDRFTVSYAKEHFRRVLEINRQTVDLPETLIVYEFMNGALEPLDEFTSMIWPIETREFDKHTRGDFVGVGISISGGGEGPIVVVTPLEDAPAYRAGIQPDDEIVAVDETSLEGVSLNKAVQMITGPIDTWVTLTINRPSENRKFDVRLKRALVEIASVKGLERDPEDPERWLHMLDEEMGIAYVRMVAFQDNTAVQLQRAIDSALARGARGLILDLRFNPGGLLKSAVEVTRLFQSRDEQVVHTEGRNDEPWAPPPAIVDGPYKDLPLVLLVNEGSASASEIVSGALQDNGRAMIIGERTFGKFSVQKLMELGGSNAYLKLTTARYYLPSGRSLHHEEGAKEWGVSPDLSVELVPKEMIRIRIMQRDRDVLGIVPSTNDKEGTAAKDGDGGKAGDAADKAADTKNGESGSGEGRPESAPNGDAKGAASDNEKTADDAKPPSGDGDKTAAPAAKDGKETDDAVDPDAIHDEEPEEGDEESDDEPKLNLAKDDNDVPDVDLQLEAALLMMRLHLFGEKQLTLAAKDAEPDAEPVHRP